MATSTIIDFLLAQQRDSSTALVGGSVTFYAAGTTNYKDVWLDNIQSQIASNPYPLDSRASATLYGAGNYKIVLMDSASTVVATWDNVYIGDDLSSIDLSTIIAAASFTNRDYIGNSQFNIWNFGTSFARTTTVDTQCADGWYLSADGSAAGTNTVTRQPFTAGQSEVPENPTYYTRLVRSVATTGATFENYCFRLPIQTAAGLEMTLRFYAKFAVAAAVTVVIKQYFGTSGSATVTTTSAGINVTDAWAKYTKTLTVPSIAGKTVGAGAYVEVGISFPVNVTYTFSLASLKYEKGTVASDNEWRTTYEDQFRTTGSAISSTTGYTLYDATGSADDKYWDLKMDASAHELYLSALDDTQTTRSNVLKATRVAGTVTKVETSVTPAAGSDDLQIATTAFVLANALLPSAIDTDSTLAADSDVLVASQKATKAFVNAAAFSGAGLSPASQAEAQAGTNNTKWMSPLRTAESIAALSTFTKYYPGVESALSAGGTLTLAHSLTVVPKLVQCFAKCVDAGGNVGYALNDVVPINNGYNGAANTGVSITFDATNITVWMGTDASVLGSFAQKGSGGSNLITASKWKLIVRAWA